MYLVLGGILVINTMIAKIVRLLKCQKIVKLLKCKKGVITGCSGIENEFI